MKQLTKTSMYLALLLTLVSSLTTLFPVTALGDSGPALNNESSTIRFAVIGDYGYASLPEGNVAALVKSLNPDFITTVGDNNYPNGSPATIDANVGQYYRQFIHPYMGTFGDGATINHFFPALGNHDWDTNQAQAYLDYFSLPGNERYYDFVWGPVHFFILDGDPREPDGITSTSTQALWLQNALANSSSPWNLVYIHQAPFSSGQHGSTPELQWPFAAWGVDAVLSGHDHIYERLSPTGNIPYFVVGLSGSSITSFMTPVNGSRVRFNGDYGAMVVDATSSDIIFKFITRSGQVIDTYSLTSTALETSKIQFEQVASGLSQPLFLTHAGDGSARSFIVERSGRIRILKKGAILPTPFLDIQPIVNSSSSEQGLLALEFHPNYQSNGKFYTVHTNSMGALVLSQFTRSSTNPDQVNADSRVELMVINHPTYTNHNGGTLAFGPDGYLYWSTGDGGGGGDPDNNAQNPGSLLGKILRIDVDSASPYAIPPSNPFYNNANPSIRQEIWALGLRNPWRISFDRLTGDLFIADVGQNAREEINLQRFNSTGGENYGWRVMEGSLCYSPSSGCNTSGKILPIAEYDHSAGCSVTGGYIYRGINYPSLRGHYLYADLCTGKLFDLYRDPQNGWTSSQLLDTSYVVSSFGEDEAGEIYLVDYNAGKIYQVQYQETITILANDDFNSAKVIGDITYTDLDLNITATTTAADDPVIPACNLNQGLSSVWYKYTPLSDHPVYLDTFGSNYDTFIAVWTGTRSNLTLIDCNDDADANTLQTALGLNLTANQTYYFEVAQFNGVLSNTLTMQPKPVELKIGGLLDFRVRFAQEVDILVSDNLKNHYFLPTMDVLKIDYPNTLNGPVKVISTDGLPIFTSQQAIYENSFSELMGYPADQFTVEYWFPWYDGVYMKTWILVGNPSNDQTAYVDIYIGGAKRNITPYAIAPGDRITPKFDGVVSGPVKVVSVTGSGTPTPLHIFASERSTYLSSFNEVMGVPFDQFTTEYWFPWYDGKYMKTWVLVGNPSSSQTAYVDIYIGGVKQGNTRPIPPNGNITPKFTGTVGGPMRVVSVSGDGTETPINIFSSERSIYKDSFNEVMGIPLGYFTTEYHYTWYDNQDLSTWILVGNPSSTQTAHVDIYIAGTKQTDTNGFMGTYAIPPGGNITPRFVLNQGPVRVVSVTGAGTPLPLPIFTSERTLYGPSFNEMMGYPTNQLSTEYWFTWYDSIYMQTQMLVGKP